jgi:hypothetical protein
MADETLRPPRPPAIRRAAFQWLEEFCFVQFRKTCYFPPLTQNRIVVEFSDGSIYAYLGLTEEDLITWANAPSHGCFFNFIYRHSTVPYVQYAAWPEDLPPIWTDDRAEVDPAWAHCLP